METLKEAINSMPLRRSVVLFPEGTRARTNSLDTFKAGAVVAARATGRAIRPMDLSRFDAAPLIAFIAAKETNYGNETDGRIPR
jgi:1-acyl-sn-glycerol-3-phosphate acyltransferase